MTQKEFPAEYTDLTKKLQEPGRSGIIEVADYRESKAKALQNVGEHVRSVKAATRG